MAWCGLVMGKIILHCLSFNEWIKTYLDILKQVVWPKIRNHVTSKRIYFQQDVASPHWKDDALCWLSSNLVIE